MREPTDIFVICYEQTPALDRCLQGVREHTGDVPYRLVVIEGKRSAAENRNEALAQVRSKWFVMIDDDAVVSPGWLETLLRYADDRVGQIQPKLLYPDGRIFSAEKVFVAPWGENSVIGALERDKGQYDYIRVAEMLSATCSLYNSAVLPACSFDTQYKGAQWEDCDFSMQIRRSGRHLLYCGAAAVCHESLYRRSSDENYAYFMKKWFGERRLTHRGVLYTGFACDIHCVFCYYKHATEKEFRPLPELKAECDRFRSAYRNTNVDISGGEPTLYRDLLPLVEHCRKIELSPTVITHGQRLTPELVRALKAAGLEDFLVSCHGPEAEHDALVGKAGGYRAMRAGCRNAQEAGIPVRTNTVVTKQNFAALPRLAREFLEWRPAVANFILFNPFEGWLERARTEFQIPYSEAAPYLGEAAALLAGNGIEPHIRYLPFCLLPGKEKYIMNFPQMPFDRWEWDLKQGAPLEDEYDYLCHALKESEERYAYAAPCQRCSLRLICSGIPKQYDRELGHDELRPRPGTLVRDPLHFQTLKAGSEPLPLDGLPALTTVEALHAVCPKLAKSDPMLLYATLPPDAPRPLSRSRPAWSRRAAKTLAKVAAAVGARRVKKMLPRKARAWVGVWEQKFR